MDQTWYHQRLEHQRYLEERKFYDSLNWFEKLIDNHWTYILVLSLSSLFGWNIGLIIGFIL